MERLTNRVKKISVQNRVNGISGQNIVIRISIHVQYIFFFDIVNIAMHTLLIQYITLHDIEPISILQCRHCRYFFEVNIVDIATYTMLCRRRYVDSMSINIVMHVDDVNKKKVHDVDTTST